jgi:hypothetical protein
MLRFRVGTLQSFVICPSSLTPQKCQRLASDIFERETLIELASDYAHRRKALKQQWATKPSTEKMAEYFIFLSACIGLTLSLIGVWLGWIMNAGAGDLGCYATMPSTPWGIRTPRLGYPFASQARRNAPLPFVEGVGPQ